MGNKYRSSFEITLNGTEYTLRPSFEAMMHFEDKCGMDVFEALQSIANKKMVGSRIVSAAIWAGIRGEFDFQGQSINAPSFSKIGSECQAHGFHNCLSFVMDFLNKSIASDEDIKKYEEAGEPLEK